MPQCVWNSDPLPAPVLGPAPREHPLCPSLSFSHFPVPAPSPLLVAPFHPSSSGTFSVTPAAASWCSDPVTPSAASMASPGCLAAHPCPAGPGTQLGALFWRGSAPGRGRLQAPGQLLLPLLLWPPCHHRSVHGLVNVGSWGGRERQSTSGHCQAPQLSPH